MTIEEAIKFRTSRRKYLPNEMDPDCIKKLQTLIDEYNKIGGFRIELVLNNGEAFDGLTRSYGMFSGVKHYIGLIEHTDDPHSREKLGYYGELLVLHATTMKLGTCWVGGTFSKSKTPFKLTKSEHVSCVITVGNVENDPSFKEKLIHRLTHRKTPKNTEMYTTDKQPPGWFLQGMAGVEKAPSAVNRQPVQFRYQSGEVSASVQEITKHFLAFDLGIAKLHFELGTEVTGKWEWGNGGRFIYSFDK